MPEDPELNIDTVKSPAFSVQHSAFSVSRQGFQQIIEKDFEKYLEVSKNILPLRPALIESSTIKAHHTTDFFHLLIIYFFEVERLMAREFGRIGQVKSNAKKSFKKIWRY